LLGEPEDLFKMVTGMARTLIAGNWKMNGTTSALPEFEQMVARLGQYPDAADCLICPPSTLLSAFARVAGPRMKLGGQTCHSAANGAFTGDVSAEMLVDAGASYVIVGHSERREYHGETDAHVAAQADSATKCGLTPIICVGETLPQRTSGEALRIVAQQLAHSIPDLKLPDQPFVIAYEPIWAIGTGEVATPAQIAEMHSEIRAQLIARFGDAAGSVPLLYGGSMKPTNATEILQITDVDGGLIGGASLKALDFMAIYEQAVGQD